MLDRDSASWMCWMCMFQMFLLFCCTPSKVINQTCTAGKVDHTCTYYIPVAVLCVLFLTSSLPFLTFSNFNSFISFPPPSHLVHLASLAHRGKPVVFKGARGARPGRGACRVQVRHVREFLLFKTLNFVSNGAFGFFKI